MPSQKNILNAFALGDLQAAVRKLEVTVQDRRRKEALIDGLLKDKSSNFEAKLAVFAAPALKAACQALGLEAPGRGKPACVAALVAAAPAKKAAVKKVATKAVASAKGKAKSKAIEAPAAKTASSRASKSAKAQPAGPAPQAPKPASPRGVALAAARVAKSAKAKQKNQAADASDAEGAVSLPVAQSPATVAAAEPAKKPTARRGPLSWSEAALMAENRGQSAATMLRPSTPQASGSAQHTCTKCHEAVTVQACQVQACNNYYVAAPGRKICSECLFERNTISMDDFNDRLREERQCAHCGVPMTHLSSVNSAAP